MHGSLRSGLLGNKQEGLVPPTPPDSQHSQQQGGDQRGTNAGHRLHAILPKSLTQCTRGPDRLTPWNPHNASNKFPWIDDVVYCTARTLNSACTSSALCFVMATYSYFPLGFWGRQLRESFWLSSEFQSFQMQPESHIRHFVPATWDKASALEPVGHRSESHLLTSPLPSSDGGRRPGRRTVLEVFKELIRVKTHSALGFLGVTPAVTQLRHKPQWCLSVALHFKVERETLAVTFHLDIFF